MAGSLLQTFFVPRPLHVFFSVNMEVRDCSAFLHAANWEPLYPPPPPLLPAPRYDRVNGFTERLFYWFCWFLQGLRANYSNQSQYVDPGRGARHGGSGVSQSVEAFHSRITLCFSHLCPPEFRAEIALIPTDAPSLIQDICCFTRVLTSLKYLVEVVFLSLTSACGSSGPVWVRSLVVIGCFTCL